MPVHQKHKDLETVWKKYVIIDDVLAGSDRVKGKLGVYLPPPNGIGLNELATDSRYYAYNLRAVFYAVAFHTLKGFVGEIFITAPAVKVPPQLEGVVKDATGDGVSLTQLAKKATGYALSKGRAGLFVDFPARNTADTVAQNGKQGSDEPTPVTVAEAGDLMPVFTVYDGMKIINWRVKKFGSKTKLCLVVLEEEYYTDTDEFGGTKRIRHRVLRLSDDERYSVQLYEEKKAGAVFWPTKGSGENFDYIPFMFIGSDTNDASVDYPPLYDLCDLNLAHYRNSADYEEAAFLCGQPTPVFSGLTEAWVDKYFGNGITLGSRAAVPLPEGASAELLSVTETTMAKEAMEHKERQMASLGAKLAEQKTVQRTATETAVDAVSEKSTLATVADNVSQAFYEGLRCAADYINAAVDDTNTEFKLNNEFSINLSTPEAVTTAVTNWQANALSFTEMRMVLRQAGYATQTDEDAKKEIDKASDEALDREVRAMEALTPIEEGDDTNDDPPPGDE